jgi:hypothetical protein
MTLHEIVSLAVSLSIAWVLYFVLWRAFVVDRYRQQMFHLRDELFDLGMARELPFDGEVYVRTRMTINGLIRRAERVSLMNLLLGALWVRNNSEYVNERMRRARDAREALAPRTRLLLESIEERAFAKTTQLMVLRNPLLFFVFGVVVAVDALRGQPGRSVELLEASAEYEQEHLAAQAA